MTPKDFLTNKAFCVLPWIGVYIQPDGEVRNCAITSQPLGNVNHESLKNILHNTTNINIKKDMLMSVKHSRCSVCHHLESNQKNHFNQTSNRVWYIKISSKNNLELYSNPESHKLKILDLRWRNTCNFACVYCGPDLSSQWAAELNISQTINKDSLDKSLAYIDSNLHQIEHVYLAGGEPLLIKENIDLLNKLYAINPDIEIRINTNLSIIDNTIYKLLKKFKNVHWTVSVDNIGKEFEYLRYGGNWNEFLNNLKQLSREFKTINFNLVWCILNHESIFNCIDLLLDMGFHENAFIVNPLEFPRELHILHLPEYKIQHIKTILQNKLNHYNSDYSLHNSMNLMFNFLNQSFEKDFASLFKFLREIDQRRKLDSQNIFPNLYSML